MSTTAFPATSSLTHRKAMPGDLAQVVLQAAREEKAKENGQPPRQRSQSQSGYHGSGSSSHAASSTRQQNGHLQPPFDWQGSGSRQVTASPEPMIPNSEAATPQDELGHGQAHPNGLSVATTPAKKRSGGRPKARRTSSKRLPSSFFGTSESAAAKHAAKRLYTSESRQDDHDEDVRQNHGHEAEAKPEHFDSGEYTRAAGTTSTASPMRGPFSRMDSSRGQNMLANQGSGSNRPSRRPSTSQPGSGDDSRRHSISGIAKRLGAMSETDETDDYESHDDGLQASNNRHLSPLQQNRARLDRMSESPENSRSANPSAPTSGANTPQRRNSVRSFGNVLGRSLNRQPSGDVSAQAAQGDASGNEKAGHSDTTVGKTKWAALRQRLKQDKRPEELQKYITGQELITDLSSGMMSIMMLKMAFDRDEHDKHRVSNEYSGGGPTWLTSCFIDSCLVELHQATNHRLGVPLSQQPCSFQNRTRVRRRPAQMGCLSRAARLRQSARSLSCCKCQACCGSVSELSQSFYPVLQPPQKGEDRERRSHAR